MYEEYSQAFCNAIAVGSFKSSAAVEKVIEETLRRGNHQELLVRARGGLFSFGGGRAALFLIDPRRRAQSLGGDESAVRGEGLLYRLFSLPLQRAREYAGGLARLATASEAGDGRVAGQLAVAARMWRAIVADNTAGLEQAATTAAFWAEVPAVRKTCAIPQRRLLLNSKTVPLYYNRTTLATNWFLLFSDIFVHVQTFSHRQYALEQLWVTDVADTDGLKHAFRLLTPEDAILVYCPTARDKAAWMHALHAAICRFLVHYDPAGEQAIMGGALSPRPQTLADAGPKYTLSQLERRRAECVGARAGRVVVCWWCFLADGRLPFSFPPPPQVHVPRTPSVQRGQVRGRVGAGTARGPGARYLRRRPRIQRSLSRRPLRRLRRADQPRGVFV